MAGSYTIKFKPGEAVVFKQWPCVVAVVNPDGTVKLKDEDGDEYDGISQLDVARPRDVDYRRGFIGASTSPVAGARWLAHAVAGLPGFKALTLMEQRVVEELAIHPGMPFVEAYYKAGGKARTIGGARLGACLLMKRPAVRAVLQEVKELTAEAFAYDREKLFRDLAHQYEVAMAAVPVLDSLGKPTGTYRVDGKTALGITKLRAQLIGELKDRLEVTGKDGAPIQHQHSHSVTVLTDEQLGRLTTEEKVSLLNLFRKARGEQGAVTVIQQPTKETSDGDSNDQGPEAIQDAQAQGLGGQPEGDRRGA